MQPFVVISDARVTPKFVAVSDARVTPKEWIALPPCIVSQFPKSRSITSITHIMQKNLSDYEKKKNAKEIYRGLIRAPYYRVRIVCNREQSKKKAAAGPAVGVLQVLCKACAPEQARGLNVRSLMSTFCATAVDAKKHAATAQNYRGARAEPGLCSKYCSEHAAPDSPAWTHGRSLMGTPVPGP